MSKPAADRTGQITDRLRTALAGSRGLVLAVSGGVDSTALMVLAALWTDRPPTLVVTIDHGLRPEGAAEAALVAKNARQLSLPFRVMLAGARPERGNLQDWARRARYGCLVQAARDARADTVVVAHHLEDQAETFLLRLARGSGVYGLSAMAEKAELEGIQIARPLLRVPRAELARVVAESGLPTVDDPSNRDRRFDRVRMRALHPVLDAHGLASARLAETARRLGRASAALDHYAHALLRESFRADGAGVVTGPVTALAAVPEEVGLRALSFMLAAVGGAEYGPRLDRLEALWRAAVGATADTRWKRTLHGVVVKLERGCVTAYREWGRGGIAAVPAAPGRPLIWDRRFRVDVPDVPGDLRLGPLGHSRDGPRFRPAAGRTLRLAIPTLPGLFRSGTLVGTPGELAASPERDFTILSVECLVAERLGLRTGTGAGRRTTELTMNAGNS